MALWADWATHAAYTRPDLDAAITMGAASLDWSAAIQPDVLVSDAESANKVILLGVDGDDDTDIYFLLNRLNRLNRPNPSDAGNRPGTLLAETGR